MNSYKQPPMKAGMSNDFQTPKEALYPLLPYLKKDWEIWECAEGKGNLTNELKRRGFKVFGTDIKDEDIKFGENVFDWKQPIIHDFLKWLPSGFDCIITNPPFSLKQQFLKRCYELGKPFALLLPLTTFESSKRQKLFKEYGLQVIFFDKRINFETPSGKGSGSWFSSAWFTYGLELPNELNFARLEHPDQKTL